MSWRQTVGSECFRHKRSHRNLRRYSVDGSAHSLFDTQTKRNDRHPTYVRYDRATFSHLDSSNLLSASEGSWKSFPPISLQIDATFHLHPIDVVLLSFIRTHIKPFNVCSVGSLWMVQLREMWKSLQMVSLFACFAAWRNADACGVYHDSSSWICSNVLSICSKVVWKPG
jgi:hypothetical protein